MPASNNQYEYFAFISYKREDEKWAKWLQRKLEYYKLPSSVRKDNPDLPEKIRPVFKDTTDLEPGVLAQKIQDALNSSQFLIVICSPRSANSIWVSKEVQSFIDSGRADHIIPFIIGGIPNAADPKEECFPEGLRQLAGEKELLGANINEMGRDAAAIKVIARMFNLRFDTLWQRYERRRRQKTIGIIAVALFAVMFALSFMMLYFDRNKAYDDLSMVNEKLIQSNEALNKSNMDLEAAYDSIMIANTIIQNKTDSLTQSKLDILRKKEALLLEGQLKEQQILYTAIYNAEASLRSENYLDAVTIALKQLKSGGRFSYSPKLEFILRTACDKLECDTFSIVKKLYPPVMLTSATSEDNDVIFIENGRYLVSYQSKIMVVDSFTGDVVATADEGVEQIGYDPGTKMLVGLSYNQIIKYDWQKDILSVKEIPDDGEPLKWQCATVSPNGKRVVTYNHKTSRYQIRDAESSETIIETKTPLTRYNINYTGEKFLSLSDNSVVENDIASGKKKKILQKEGIKDYCYADDGHTIIVLSEDSIFSVYDPRSDFLYSIKLDSEAETYWVCDVAISKDRRYIASNNFIIDLTSGKTHIYPFDLVRKYSFGGNSNILYVLNTDFELNLLYRSDRGPIYRKYFMDPAPMFFLPDNSFIGHDHNVWALGTPPELIGPNSDNDTDSDYITYHSPDNSLYAIGKDPVVIYDSRTHKNVGTPIALNTELVGHISFSSDNKQIVISGFGKETMIYDIHSGEPVYDLQVQYTGAFCGEASFGSDNTLFISSSDPEFYNKGLLYRIYHPYPEILKYSEQLINLFRKSQRKADL